MPATPAVVLPGDLPNALKAAGAGTGELYALPEVAARIITVGIGKQFATLAAAVAASRDGDVIKVDAGTYVNDTATINTKVIILGVGGMVNLVATQPLANGKGILVVNTDVTIANISFSGAAVGNDSGANGAGIRYQGGRLTLVNDVFTGNQNGLLAVPVNGLAVNTITIDRSTFNGNGVSDPALTAGYGYTHNAYIGGADKFTVTNSVFANANVGHELKSRALVNEIRNNVFSDGQSSASYSIDLPNGGQSTVAGNYIEQGANSQNGAIIHFGGEGFPYVGSSLAVTGNTIVNHAASNPVGVLNQTILTATVSANTVSGLTAAQLVSGPVKATGNVSGSGEALPDSVSGQALPSNFIQFTDALPHKVVLTSSDSGVMGGGGLLTVDGRAGHVTVIGGTGGLVFTERSGTGGSSIATQAGAADIIRLSGQSSVLSAGSDTITVGAGNATVLVTGTARITSGTGSNHYTVNGTATLTGKGGSDFLNIGQGGKVTAAGAFASLEVGILGGTCVIDARIGGLLEQARVQGGSVSIRSYDGALNFETSGGYVQGATIRLGAGAIAVKSRAADTIHAGSGIETLQLSGGGQVVHAGTGQLKIYGMGIDAAHRAVVHGNGGWIFFGGDTGNITYLAGDKASTVDASLANMTLVGGKGLLTVNNAVRDVITGGKGGLVLNGAAASTITTAAVARDVLTLTGPCVVESWGNDLINAGSANHTLTLRGNATVAGASGTDKIAVYGTAKITATGGNEQVTVAQGGLLTMQSAAWTNLTETGGTVGYTATGGGDRSSVTVTGGSASIFSAPGSPLKVTTQAGFATKVDLGTGRAQVDSRGADLISTGAGTNTVNAGGDDTVIHGGSGALVVNNVDYSPGHSLTVHGGTGSFTYNNGGPGTLVFIGGSGSAAIKGTWGVLDIKAGSGDLSITGGSGGTLHFVAGSGEANLAVSAAGSDITFGSGVTTIASATSGSADIYHFIAGHGGGLDVIQGFRSAVDQLRFEGVGVTSMQVLDGDTWLTLNDQTRVELVGVTALNLPDGDWWPAG